MNVKYTLLIIPVLIYGILASHIYAASVFINSFAEKILIGSEHILEASFSASPNKNYFLKARLGSESASLKKALTKNETNTAPDDWLSDSDSWTKFPKVSTNAEGLWSGQVKFKALESTFLGTNLLRLRIRPQDLSSNIDSSSYSLSVGPNPSSDGGETSKLQEIKVIKVAQKIKLDSEFDIEGTIRVSGGSRLNLKALIGESGDTKDMRDGFTLGNEGKWLAWNAAWSKFPEVSLVGSTANFTFKAKVDKETTTEKVYLVVRVHDPEKNTNIDSEPLSLEVEKTSEPPPTPPSNQTNQEASQQIGQSDSTISPSPETSKTNSPSTVPSSQSNNASKKTETKNPKNMVKKESLAKARSPEKEDKKEISQRPMVRKSSSKEEKRSEVAKVLNDLNIPNLVGDVLGTSSKSAYLPLEQKEPLFLKNERLTKESYVLIAVGMLVVLIGSFQLVSPTLQKYLKGFNMRSNNE